MRSNDTFWWITVFFLQLCIERVLSAGIPQTEYQALLDLYTATNGANWDWRSNEALFGVPWNFSQVANPCADRWQGVICSTEANTSHVVTMLLSEYNLNGSIPASIVELSKVTKLDLSYNYLTGPLPHHMSSFADLEELILTDNQLYGEVGIVGGALLRKLYLDSNYFSYVTSEIGSMTQLEYIILNNNNIAGTIPTSVWDLRGLEYLYLQENYLSGVLNQLLVQAVFVQNLNLSSNAMSGTLPETLGSLNLMHQLYLSDNIFTGTIPASIGNATQLSQFDLSGTGIGGAIPSSMRNLSHLITLSLQTGFFTGSLEHVFSPSQTNLTAIQLDNNQFTGTLPAALFDLPSLASVSIIGSCITGSFPDNVCNLQNLQALVMYGLTTGSNCRQSGRQTLQSWQHSSFGGAFPACLLALPKIRTIFLSSNGLTGSMHSDWPASPSLTQLDLSHNALSGSIPRSLQDNTWSLLDLSHNKLSGSLHAGLFSTANVSAELTLDTNRLSGDIPKSIRAVQNISVLAGNLFACDLTKSDLPTEDDQLRTYSCSSNSFNIAVFIWLGLCVAAGVMVYHRYHALLSLQLLQLSEAVSDRLSALNVVMKRCGELNTYSMCCTAFCMLVLLPYYAIVSHFKGTHTHQYAYVISAIYASGVTVFVCNFVFFAGLLVALYVSFNYKLSRYKVAQEPADANTWLKRVCVWIIFASINTGAVVGVNIGYVNIILYGSSQGQAVAQVALSLFKLAWGVVAAPFLIRQLELLFFPAVPDSSESFFVLQVIVTMFNNIAIPCLVVAAIDPNCFRNILEPPEAETVDYQLPVCYAATIEEQCTSFVYQPATLMFTPPFVYSYQCSASFITTYAPAFMYMSISTVFILPLLHYFLLRLRELRQPSDGLFYAMLFRLMPRILKPLEEGPVVGDARRRPYARALGTMVNILSQLGVLLTFGVIFPPIALAMALSIATTVYLARAKIQRFVLAAIDANRLEYIDLINAECLGVGTAEQMIYSVEILICFSCAFYALFLFDALGDTQGFAASVWVLILVPLAPFALFGLSKALSVVRTATFNSPSENETSAEHHSVREGGGNGKASETDVELKHVVNAIHNSSV